MKEACGAAFAAANIGKSVMKDSFASVLEIEIGEVTYIHA